MIKELLDKIPRAKSKYVKMSLSLILFLIIIDLLYSTSISNIIVGIVVIVWTVSSILFKPDIVYSFIISLCMLVLLPILLLLGAENIAERVAGWAYIFLSFYILACLFTSLKR